ncbi:hypothetical protein CBL_09832 [Carabus blaptoides fortunei]
MSATLQALLKALKIDELQGMNELNYDQYPYNGFCGARKRVLSKKRNVHCQSNGVHYDSHVKERRLQLKSRDGQKQKINPKLIHSGTLRYILQQADDEADAKSKEGRN